MTSDSPFPTSALDAVAALRSRSESYVAWIIVCAYAAGFAGLALSFFTAGFDPGSPLGVLGILLLVASFLGLLYASVAGPGLDDAERNREQHR
jgi:hypothetical protein